MKVNLAVTGTEYTVSGLEANTEYSFFVQAYKGGKWLTGGDESYASAKTDGLNYPVLTAEGGDKSVKLTWTAVDGAVKYGVYEKVGTKYVKVNLNVTGTEYTVSGLKADTKYSFFVQAYTTKWLPANDASYASAKTN